MIAIQVLKNEVPENYLKIPYLPPFQSKVTFPNILYLPRFSRNEGVPYLEFSLYYC